MPFLHSSPRKGGVSGSSPAKFADSSKCDAKSFKKSSSSLANIGRLDRKRDERRRRQHHAPQGLALHDPFPRFAKKCRPATCRRYLLRTLDARGGIKGWRIANKFLTRDQGSTVKNLDPEGSPPTPSFPRRGDPSEGQTPIPAPSNAVIPACGWPGSGGKAVALRRGTACGS